MRSTIKRTLTITEIECVRPIYRNGEIVAEKMKPIVVYASIRDASRYAQRFYKSSQIVATSVKVERATFEMTNEVFVKHASRIDAE